MRREFVRGMEFAGVEIDDGKNAAAAGGVQADVSAADSAVKVGQWCLPRQFLPPSWECS